MRTDDNGDDRVSASRKHLVFAYYITGHGFGHATRVVEVVRHLIDAGHDVHVVTGAPDFVFTTEIQSPKLHIRKVLLDCGAVQADALTVDRLASLEKVSDVVPVACRAAADAGIRSVCVTNFSWDFIYAEYVMAAGYHHRSIVWQVNGPVIFNVPAFRDVIDVPLVVRRLHKSRTEVRKELGIGNEVKLVIFNFGGQVAARILQNIAFGRNYDSDKFSGARRLRDAIILGYQLQRAPGRDMSIPDWYILAENEASLRQALPSGGKMENGYLMESCIEDLEILHGELHGLSDTVAFLKSLSGLSRGIYSGLSPEKRQLRDRIAAAGLFNWEEEIFVARAPGRLDVMGGIADYSGSLVLQMPIREACHVAVQRNHPSKHKLWKHALARQNAKGQGPTPVLQIVSYGSELSNRAPTFDMDLSDLLNGDQPITYEEAHKYFAQDPSQKWVSFSRTARWAAYVAGTILVLMSELGIRFNDSISILVSSAVPEGKGVSSSASVEVENRIVGAPCGVMDQMTSACGEANKLLAMVCQPAEIKELVVIPTHIRFWGIDSGIRHSVGGADYGSVRIGTFMGRKMIKSTASALLSQSLANGGNPSHNVNGINSDEFEEHGIDLVRAEASLDYLCNLSTQRYEAVYAKKIPEYMLGATFLEKYTDHNDSVTVIDPKCKYGVRAPTKHPIYENFRVKAFKALLTAATTDEQLSSLGELMYQCHYSYNDCGLGSDGTDRLVKLVQETQYHRNENGSLFGAKITGGGSGGSIQQRYKAATGFLPHIFEGSSPGAGKFGYLKVRRRSSPVFHVEDEKQQLLLGIRRANRQPTNMSSSVLSSDSMHIGILAAAAHAAANHSPFTVFYNPRASPSEFVIPLAKYNKAIYSNQISLGMRFRMLFETEESGTRRYMGTITGISDLDPVRWKNSPWRNLQVGWDESAAGERRNKSDYLRTLASPVLQNLASADLSRQLGLQAQLLQQNNIQFTAPKPPSQSHQLEQIPKLPVTLNQLSNLEEHNRDSLMMSHHVPLHLPQTIVQSLPNKS
ncbi:L-arabinokinase [Acorus calamus]|uniref:L-arabinokinase n=1 Tax=Acorus calamus TaxID=4465 RepID=A0AAV9FAS4_ACOCL|nr:L-arabinokinase [Acorus calamus]